MEGIVALWAGRIAVECANFTFIAAPRENGGFWGGVMQKLPKLRIFVSSPGDLRPERECAEQIIKKLAWKFRRFYGEFEPILWENEPLGANKHFQDGITPPSETDIVIVMLWSRLGTPLPLATPLREYVDPDGREVTGTEWEFLNALEAANTNGKPDILVFRKEGEEGEEGGPRLELDKGKRKEQAEAADKLDEFLERYFADGNKFKAAFHTFSALEAFKADLKGKLCKLIEQYIEDRGEDATWLEGTPFCGLGAYEYKDGAVYWGRDEAVANAANQLEANAKEGTAFLLISGASGSGKSSLVQAGLLPRLMDGEGVEGVAFLRYAVFRPGGQSDPILKLVQALTSVGDEKTGLPELLAPGQTAENLAEKLRSTPEHAGDDFHHELARLTKQAQDHDKLSQKESAKLILVVDQLEELFTEPSITSDARQQFARVLKGISRSGWVWVIATQRADFWSQAMEIEELRSLAQGAGNFYLGAPSPSELAEIVSDPARMAGLKYGVDEGGKSLSDIIADEAAKDPEGVLPLLSFLLQTLYHEDVEKKPGGKKLTIATYRELGGLNGAISKYAENLRMNLDQPVRDAVPRVLRELVTVSRDERRAPTAKRDGDRPALTTTRRTVPLARFGEGTPQRAVVDAFTHARLMVKKTGDDSIAMVSLAHEALITHWDWAKTELGKALPDLETKLRIEPQYERWKNAKGIEEKWKSLLRDPDLANAIDLKKRWGDELDAGMTKFIAASRRKAQLGRYVMIAAVVLFAWLALFALFAMQRADFQRMEADRQRDLLDRGWITNLGRQALSELERGKPDRALRFAVYAARNDLNLPEGGPSVATASLAAVMAKGGNRWAKVWRWRTVGPPPLDGIYEPASSTDRPDWRMLAPFPEFSLSINSMDISPDGTHIVVGLASGLVGVADMNGKLHTIRPADSPGNGLQVRSVSFSHGGEYVVTASDDKTVHVLDVNTGEDIFLPFEHETGVTAAVMSVDEKLLVTVTNDGAAHVWDVSKRKSQLLGEKIHEDIGHVNSVNFSSDGSRMVVASSDGVVRVVEVQNSGEFAETILRMPQDAIVLPVSSAKFDSTGSLVVAAYADGVARVWDVEKVTMLRELLHPYPVVSAAFSSDGKQIVTTSGDFIVRVWDMDEGADSEEVKHVLSGHELLVTSIVFGRGDAQVVTASWDGTVRIWDLAGSQDFQEVEWYEAPSRRASSGEHVILIEGDAAVIKEANSGKLIRRLQGRGSRAVYAFFSADGMRAAVAWEDGTTTIWDVTRGEEGSVLQESEGFVMGFAAWPMAFDPKDSARILLVSTDGIATIVDTNTKSRRIDMNDGVRDGARVSSAFFSPDGKFVATLSNPGDGLLRIWDAAEDASKGTTDGPELMQNPHGQDGYNTMVGVFSPNEKRKLVATAAGRIARVWDWGELPLLMGTERGGIAIGWKPVSALHGHAGDIFNLYFSADGSRIVTASQDQTVRVWDVNTGIEIQVLYVPGLQGAEFDVSGNAVVVASNDLTARGKVALWKIPYATLSLEQLLSQACNGPLVGISRLQIDELPLLGFRPDPIRADVCAGIQ